MGNVQLATDVEIPIARLYKYLWRENASFCEVLAYLLTIVLRVKSDKHIFISAYST